MKHNSKRAVSASNLIEVVILIAVAAYVLGAIFGGALTAIATTPLTSVNSTVASLYQNLLPIILVVAIVLLFYYAVVKPREA